MDEKTWHIHIKGQVQGVGFRPFVYQKAREFGLSGWVNNATDGVHCEFNATEKNARQFYQTLISEAPALSDITSHELKKSESKIFDNFRIVHSDSSGEANLLLTSDFALCDDCRNELFSEANRRRGYPFITCTNCGPRYSITEKLPYDRETTTMEKFGMCQRCRTEYNDPLDRRYYSQTNSCGKCGITMSLYDADQNLLGSVPDVIIAKISRLWNDGKIVALKGIGGYLLTCDATNKAAIQTLRERKQRPAKPFALMYPDIEALEKDLFLDEGAKRMLGNSISPIIVAAVKEKLPSGICLQEVAPGFTRLGAMIPYTPLYALLLQLFGPPIVATSGNITNSPIVYSDQKALNELLHIADYLLANNREIAIPQDDSVVTFSPGQRQKIIYRRSRGIAPSYINPDLALPDATILATGGMLKSTFGYVHKQNVFISQYLGDLDHFDTGQNYKQVVEHFFQLFDERPDIVLADKHPDYFSTRFAEQLSDELSVPIKKYQHHKAHFAAVLGEHSLLDPAEPVLGVVWDGTGWGDDGQVWGGEFFIYKNRAFSHCGQFNYFNFIAGDKMPREPRISALAATKEAAETGGLLEEKFSEIEWSNYQTLLQRSDNLQTSSVGRLFDAVSSLLGIIDQSSYEGQAAMLLETEARKYVNQNGLSFSGSYFSGTDDSKISVTAILQGILSDLEQGVNKQIIAAQFHYSLVEVIAAVARQQNVSKIAFSGGVFQNALLVDLIIHHLDENYDLFFHQKFSPNDENISFGQLMCYVIGLGRDNT